MDNRYGGIEQANSSLPKAREISAGFFLFFCCEERFTPISFFLFYAPPLTPYDGEFSNGWRVSRVCGLV